MDRRKFAQQPFGICNVIFNSIHLIYFQTNVKTIDTHFVRKLSMAILKTSVDDSKKFNSLLFEKRCKLLSMYLENKRKLKGDGGTDDEEKRSRELQLHCLYGIQRVDFEMEHPKGTCRRHSKVKVGRSILLLY